MSPRPSDSSRPSGPFRKPRPDLYTMMLLVAFLALVIGTVFLYLEAQRLEGRAQGPGPSGQALLAGTTAIGSQRSAIGFVRDFRSLDESGSLLA